jgi:hypothetical protein
MKASTIHADVQVQRRMKRWRRKASYRPSLDGSSGVGAEGQGSEDRLRRMAKRQGLTLTKTRRRDPRALDYGCFWLNDARNGARVFGGEWGAGLDEIEAWLLGYEKALPKHKRKAARGQ